MLIEIKRAYFESYTAPRIEREWIILSRIIRLSLGTNYSEMGEDHEYVGIHLDNGEVVYTMEPLEDVLERFPRVAVL